MDHGAGADVDVARGCRGWRRAPRPGPSMPLRPAARKSSANWPGVGQDQVPDIVPRGHDAAGGHRQLLLGRLQQRLEGIGRQLGQVGADRFGPASTSPRHPAPRGWDRRPSTPARPAFTRPATTSRSSPGGLPRSLTGQAVACGRRRPGRAARSTPRCRSRAAASFSPNDVMPQQSQIGRERSADRSSCSSRSERSARISRMGWIPSFDVFLGRGVVPRPSNPPTSVTRSATPVKSSSARRRLDAPRVVVAGVVHPGADRVGRHRLAWIRPQQRRQALESSPLPRPAIARSRSRQGSPASDW